MNIFINQLYVIEMSSHNSRGQKNKGPLTLAALPGCVDIFKRVNPLGPLGPF